MMESSSSDDEGCTNEFYYSSTSTSDEDPVKCHTLGQTSTLNSSNAKDSISSFPAVNER